MGLEPTASSLARKRSTAELHPLTGAIIYQERNFVNINK